MDDLDGAMDRSETQYVPLSRYSQWFSTRPLRERFLHMQFARRRTVLEVGTFSGFSALAWYEGTKATQAQIVTLELSPEMIKVAREIFKKTGVEDRVELVEGPASET